MAAIFLGWPAGCYIGFLLLESSPRSIAPLDDYSPDAYLLRPGGPTTSLIQGGDGKIYGTLQYFGGLGGGAIFQIVFGQPGAVNISTRMNVGTGDNVSIGVFIVTGNSPKKVMVRAIGPFLAARSISGRLDDPTLELHDGTGALIGKNDNWRTTQIGGRSLAINQDPSQRHSTNR